MNVPRQSSVGLATTCALATTVSGVGEALAGAGGDSGADRPKVVAVAEPSAPFLSVTDAVAYGYPARAAVANAYATTTPGAVARLEGRSADAADLTVLTPAAALAEPARPSRCATVVSVWRSG